MTASVTANQIALRSLLFQVWSCFVCGYRNNNFVSYEHKDITQSNNEKTELTQYANPLFCSSKKEEIKIMSTARGLICSIHPLMMRACPFRIKMIQIINSGAAKYHKVRLAPDA